MGSIIYEIPILYHIILVSLCMQFCAFCWWSKMVSVCSGQVLFFVNLQEPWQHRPVVELKLVKSRLLIDDISKRHGKTKVVMFCSDPRSRWKREHVVIQGIPLKYYPHALLPSCPITLKLLFRFVEVKLLYCSLEYYFVPSKFSRSNT